MRHNPWQTASTANADRDEASPHKDRSDYIAELAGHLDVETSALETVLSDASLSVIKALAIELGPASGELAANASVPEEYSDGTIDGRSRDTEDNVDIATARERVQTLVANSAGNNRGSTEHNTQSTVKRIHAALDEIEDKMVTEQEVYDRVNNDQKPSANVDGEGDELDDYSDGTIGGDL